MSHYYGYGGYGYGYGGYGYGGYGYYNNYYNYQTMAQYAFSSATKTTSSTELDKDRYYRAVLRGPKADGKKPKLKVTFAIPKGFHRGLTVSFLFVFDSIRRQIWNIDYFLLTL